MVLTAGLLAFSGISHLPLGRGRRRPPRCPPPGPRATWPRAWPSPAREDADGRPRAVADPTPARRPEACSAGWWRSAPAPAPWPGCSAWAAASSWFRRSPGLLKLPMKLAVGSSLVAVAIFSVPALVTHALLGHIDWRFALPLVVGVVPGAQVGARAHHRLVGRGRAPHVRRSSSPCCRSSTAPPRSSACAESWCSALAVGMALAYALTTGFHNGANANAALVVTRVARPAQAMALTSVFCLLGAARRAAPWSPTWWPGWSGSTPVVTVAVLGAGPHRCHRVERHHLAGRHPVQRRPRPDRRPGGRGRGRRVAGRPSTGAGWTAWKPVGVARVPPRP